MTGDDYISVHYVYMRHKTIRVIKTIFVLLPLRSTASSYFRSICHTDQGFYGDGRYMAACDFLIWV